MDDVPDDTKPLPDDGVPTEPLAPGEDPFGVVAAAAQLPPDPAESAPLVAPAGVAAVTGPTQPLAAEPLAEPAPAPPPDRRRAAWLPWVLAALLAVALGVVALVVLPRLLADPAGPVPAPTASATPKPTSTPTAPAGGGQPTGGGEPADPNAPPAPPAPPPPPPPPATPEPTTEPTEPPDPEPTGTPAP